MPKPSPSLYAAAVLIWLPRGELPDVRRFDMITVQPPPTPNPHPWWLQHEAINETAVSHGSAYPGNLLFGSPSLPFGASPNLVLPIGDLLLGFGQTLLNDRAVHCVSGPRPSSAAEQRAATDRPA